MIIKRSKTPIMGPPYRLGGFYDQSPAGRRSSEAGLVYLGRSVNVLSGFQGVTPGGTASINLPVNQRNHRLNLQCQGILFTGPTLTLIGAGTVNVTFTFTIGAAGSGTPGSITAIAFGGTNTGMTNGTYTSTLTGGKQAIITDPTGFGATCTVTIAGGAVTGIVVNSGGVQAPLDPRLMITSMKQIVNGQVIRDISPTSIIGILNHWGYIPQTGSLPLIYTEPKRNFLRDAEMNSWDLTAQNTFQLQFGISASVGSPNVYGVMEFDLLRNARTCTAQNQKYLGTQANGQPWPIGAKVPFLDPIAQHQFSYPITTGRFDITTVPFNYPISKIYIAGATAGQIYGLDVLADGALVYQTLAKDMDELNSQYDYQTGNALTAPASNGGGFGGNANPSGTPNPTNATGQVPTTIPNGPLNAATGVAAINGFAWDAVCVFDMDGRPWKAIRAQSSFVLRLYSNMSMNVTVVVESRPKAYLG